MIRRALIAFVLVSVGCSDDPAAAPDTRDVVDRDTDTNDDGSGDAAGVDDSSDAADGSDLDDATETAGDPRASTLLAAEASCDPRGEFERTSHSI